MSLALNIYDDLKLRLGTPDDMREVMDLAIAAAEENGAVSANKLLLAKAVWPKLNLQHGLIGCIGPKDGRIEGLVVLQIGKLFYSDEMCLEELVLYVHPDYRNAKVGRARKLCEFSKSVADRLEVPLIIGVFSSEMTKQKCKLYERVLGAASGQYWIYGRKTGGHPVL